MYSRILVSSALKTLKPARVWRAREGHLQVAGAV